MTKSFGYYGVKASPEAEADFQRLTKPQLVALLEAIVELMAEVHGCEYEFFFDRYEPSQVDGRTIDMAKAVINRIDEVDNGAR
jgi:hypothetical protein